MPIAPPGAVNETLALLRIISDPAAAKEVLDELAARENEVAVKLVALRELEAGVKPQQDEIEKMHQGLAERQAVVDANELDFAARLNQHEQDSEALKTEKSDHAQAVSQWRSAVASAKKDIEARKVAAEEAEAAAELAHSQLAAARQQIVDDRKALDKERDALQERAATLRAAAQQVA